MRMPSRLARAYGAQQASPGRRVMLIRDIYTPNAHVTQPDQALAEAARIMLQSHIGCMIVADSGRNGRKPVGILTDRDMVRGQLRLGADLFCLTVGDVMTPDPLGIPLDTGVTEAIEAMQARGVRRAPVADGAGNLLGIITLDDLLPAVARELEELTALIGTQARREGKLTG
jgi:CBS domain-containing protein